MSAPQHAVGSIGWTDLTVADAAPLRDFYQQVVGWKVAPFDMGGYEDYSMLQPESGQAVAGVCHARGANADLPPVWMVYMTVANLEESLERCVALGGKPLGAIRTAGGYGRFCVIQDPAGATCALFQQA